MGVAEAELEGDFAVDAGRLRRMTFEALEG